LKYLFSLKFEVCPGYLLDFINITLIKSTFKIALLMGLLDCVFFFAGTGFKAFFEGFVDACSSAYDGIDVRYRAVWP
jgi:hypothetical protein